MEKETGGNRVGGGGDEKWGILVDAQGRKMWVPGEGMVNTAEEKELLVADGGGYEVRERSEWDGEKWVKQGEEEVAGQGEEIAGQEEEALARDREETLAREVEEDLARDREEVLVRGEDLKREYGQNEAEIREIDEKLAKIKEYEQNKVEIREIDEQLMKPLVAINANFEYDEGRLARDLVERELKAEVDEAKGWKGFAKRIWKGNLFKKYYERKYERELLEGVRKVEVDGEAETVRDLVLGRSDGAIKRFVLGVTEEYGEEYIHSGESKSEADAHTTEVVRRAIEEYATAELREGESLDDLRREFGNKIGRLKQEARDRGEEVNESLVNNYFEVAKQARMRVEHDMAIEKVMEGFKVYNAEVRDGVRTEAHRDNLDKIIDKIGNFAGFVPPEIIAAGVGVTAALAQTGVRALGGVATGIGGAGVLAAFRERNRVTADRVRMARDIANGLGYGEKQSRYELSLGGTQYDMRPASELAGKLKEAIESGNKGMVRRALAEAKVRRDFSDSESRDLISYSSEDARGGERLDLDMAIVMARQMLSKSSEAEKRDLAAEERAVMRQIKRDLNRKDEKFRALRRKAMLKQAGKTVAIGAVAFLGSQELIAELDPNKISLLEKLRGEVQNSGANETALAGLVKTEISGVKGTAVEAMKRYEGAGLKKVKTGDAWQSQQNDLVGVEPQNSINRLRVAYDGWANNGTTVADGNELKMFMENGQMVSGMSGGSTMGEQVLDYGSAMAEGKVKGFLTVGGAKFELLAKVNEAGQLTWGENGVFTTATGETIRAVGDNGEKLYDLFEVAMDNGLDGEGIKHIVPFATDVGRGASNVMVQQIAKRVVNYPEVFSFFGR